MQKPRGASWSHIMFTLNPGFKNCKKSSIQCQVWDFLIIYFLYNSSISPTEEAVAVKISPEERAILEVSFTIFFILSYFTWEVNTKFVNI